MLSGGDWEEAVPQSTLPLLQNSRLHTLEAGERAVLAKLRTMADEDFERLPYGSEGLWRKLMKACRSQNDLNSIIEATKSKRYTRTRIDRMILCAFLGLTEADMGVLPPAIRPLRTGAVPSSGGRVCFAMPEKLWTKEKVKLEAFTACSAP